MGFRDALNGSSTPHLDLGASNRNMPALMICETPIVFTEMQVPSMCHFCPSLRALVLPSLGPFWIAAYPTYVYCLVFITISAKILLVIRVLYAVIRVILIGVVARTLSQAPRNFTEVLVVDECHGYRFLEFGGSTLFFASPHEVLLDQENVDQDPRYNVYEYPVLCVAGYTYFSNDVTDLHDCLR